jgi:hypothetical protein
LSGAVRNRASGSCLAAGTAPGNIITLQDLTRLDNPRELAFSTPRLKNDLQFSPDERTLALVSRDPGT